MTYSSYRVKVPGKLLIAGEYAVLEPNQHAVVIAINRYMTATIEPSKQNTLSLPDLGLEGVTWGKDSYKVRFSKPDPQLNFIQQAIEVTNQFLLESSIDIVPFHIRLSSELNDSLSGRKYGLGSSAAVVVAVTTAMLKLHGFEMPSLNQIFKLSAIAHLRAQKSGSGVDIAASTYGGWLVYSSYQPKWIIKRLEQRTRLIDLVNMPWPNLSITPISAPSCLSLCVGWTKEAASTGSMIKKVWDFKNKNPKAYQQFLNASTYAVESLRKGFEEDDCSLAHSSLTENRHALKRLGDLAGVRIETNKLIELIEVAEKYGSCKPSGAGGGDCGIVFMMGESQKEKLYRAWETVGVLPLKLSVPEQGVSVSEYNCEPSLKEYLCAVND